MVVVCTQAVVVEEVGLVAIGTVVALQLNHVRLRWQDFLFLAHDTSLLESCGLGYVVRGCQHTRGSVVHRC